MCYLNYLLMKMSIVTAYTNVPKLKEQILNRAPDYEHLTDTK